MDFNAEPQDTPVEQEHQNTEAPAEVEAPPWPQDKPPRKRRIFIGLAVLALWILGFHATTLHSVAGPLVLIEMRSL